MIIDWFTVGAQALNFVILMGLLKHFLYRPILDAIETREKRIAGQLADAHRQKAEAHKEKDDFAQKNRAFDADRAALLKKASDAADAEGQALLAAARTAADALAAQRHAALQAEDVALAAAVRRRTSDGVFAVTTRLMADLADASLDASIARLFLRRLGAMDPADVAAMTATLAAARPAKAMVHSAFAIPAGQQAVITKAIRARFASDAAIRFETRPALIGGIALVAGGRTLGWNIADYLQAMQAGVDALLDTEPTPMASAQPPAKPAAKRASKPAPKPAA